MIALCNIGCASSSDQAPEPSLHVLPVSSFVQPISPMRHDLDWEVVLRAHLAGQPAYDAVFRRTAGPVSAMPVSCNETQSIGVYLEAKPAFSKRMAQKPLRFTWTHATLGRQMPARSSYRQAWLTPRAQGVLIYSDKLSLNEARRIDGEWILDVYQRGKTIYRERFLLTDCDKSDAPEWYEETEMTGQLSPSADP